MEKTDFKNFLLSERCRSYITKSLLSLLVANYVKIITRGVKIYLKKLFYPRFLIKSQEKISENLTFSNRTIYSELFPKVAK